jgi:phage terminase large subunit GpA-like protein
MATMQCETCGNDYDKAFELVMGGEKHVFDSFECAIQAMAPRCAHCECRIIGHGVEEGDSMYCCSNCAQADGRTGVRDRA